MMSRDRTEPESGAGGRSSFRKAMTIEAISAYAFIAPLLLVMGVFVLFPLVQVFLLSLADATFYNYPGKFIGLKNFVDLFTWDDSWWQAIANTLIIAAVNIPVGIVLGLGSALLVNQRIPGSVVFRWGFLVPLSGSSVAVALMWLAFYEPSRGGILNYLLTSVGLLDAPVSWLGDPKTALGAVIFTMVGRFGFRMLIYLSALQGIPDELYEAAEMDGASRWRVLRNVTWPQVAPATFFIVINNLASSLNQGFQEVYVLTGGGPLKATRVVSLSIYESGFVYGELGYACAISIVVLVLSAVITLSIGRNVRSEA